MKSKKFLSFIVLLVIATINVIAVPANKTPITIKQPNGKMLTFILQGDERIHWATTLDNYSLLSNKEGNYVYAILDKDGNMVPSNILACNEEERSVQENEFLSKINKELFFSKSQIEKAKQAMGGDNSPKKKVAGQKLGDGSQVGTKNMLIILVNFQDKAFNFTKQDFVNKYSLDGNTAYNATGSAKDYYRDCSRGQLNLNFTVVGPYTLSQNMSYYGAASWWNDSKPWEMAQEAVALANVDVNYSNFDNDGDGSVDFVHIIYAGSGENESGNTNEIWPHSWNFSLDSMLDGKEFYKYSCSNERKVVGDINGIGTACHEIGHDLGLPDYYDTDYWENGGTSNTLGSWELMDAGSYNNNSNTPPLINAFSAEKLRWMNIPILTDHGEYSLPAFSDSASAFRVQLSSDEFYILEHRRKKKWDAYVKGEGLLVYHGDYRLINPWFESRSNTINVTPTDRGFYFEPSSGNIGDVNSNKLPFSNNTFPAFTDITNPTTKLKNGTIVNTPFTYIRYIDTIIYFKYKSDLGQVINKGHDLYSIDSNRANVMAAVAHWGNMPVIEKGFIWSKDSLSLDYENGNICSDTSSQNTYTTVLTKLPGNGTRVYYRPFLRYANDIVYGDNKSLLSRGDEVGLDKIQNEIKVSIYPNPTNNYLWISMDNINNSSYEIFDIRGKLIKPSTRINSSRTKVDLSNISKGVYLIKIIANKTSSIKKLILN